jgi:hypothetical protein
MIKRSLLCVTLFTAVTLAALNAQAPARVQSKAAPVVWSVVENPPEAQFTDYSFVFIEGE